MGPIPLYGRLSGMQYDHHTKQYYGDGPPRSTSFRPDGTWPCKQDQACGFQSHATSLDTRKLPNDALHLQPKLEVRARLENFGVNGIATMKLCRCINMWGTEPAMTEHVCTEPTVNSRVRATPVRINMVRSSEQSQAHVLPGLPSEREHTKAQNNASTTDDPNGRHHTVDQDIVRKEHDDESSMAQIARDFGNEH